MSTQDTIILIEDSIETGTSIKYHLQKLGYKVIWFPTFDIALDGLEQISSNPKDSPGIEAIIFDYSLDKDQSTIPLVQIISEWGFQGPMIANSSDLQENTLLQQAGCTHIRPGDQKIRVAAYLVELFME
jgi:DNA-binding response OmpR family regulator